MIVCLCKRVTEKQLCELAEQSSTFAEYMKHTDAARDCMSCIEKVKQLYEETNGQKRRAQRVEAKLSGTCNLIGSPEWYRFSTLNLSSNGILFETQYPTPYRKESLLEMELDLGTERITFLGKPVRRLSDTQFAVSIIQITPADQNKLKALTDTNSVA